MNDKPLVIRIREAKDELLRHLNAVLQEKELPCYIIEPIIAELHTQVSRSAQAEYEQAVTQLATTTKDGGRDDGP